ncbi:DUF3558 domain-containing protein [Streptomyces sp. NPDC014894]|uniref:DUF3558 domain-containing protein n=1 Tax=Streptomyces sp. NPDC014894 TaxID=3364931 RepID=UPI003702CA2F
MHRSAPRLARILACAAVPVMLAVTGCSSDSGDKTDKADKSAASGASGGGEGSSSESAAPQAKKSPAVEREKFAKLPDACKSIPAKSVAELVPETKTKGGTAGRSTDIMSRASCSWNSLDDNGVKGSQYRWLDVAFLRYESDEALAVTGAKRAEDSFAKELSKAQGVSGAKKVKTAELKGVGDRASAVTYELRKTGEDFSYVTVVARTENAVVSLTYNGTGYAGAKPPAVSDLSKDAASAAKEAVGSVTAANK